MAQTKKLLFSTAKYKYLQEKILAVSREEEGLMEEKTFPDGEIYNRIITNVEDRDVVLLGGTTSDGDIVELFDFACSFVKYGASSLTLVIPFFGYSTMERAVKYGEMVKAKTRAMLLSAIPLSPRGNKIMMMDLHTEGLQHYFEGGLRPIHIYCKSIVKDVVTELGGKNIVLASTDAGRAKWVESLANDIGINAAFVFKRRISGEETEVTAISADVKNKDVVIYDDMIRTGGSVVNAAKAYKSAGANNIYVITTHGLFNNGGLEKIKKSGVVKAVYSTDTHPNVNSINDTFLKIRSVASLIAENLDKNY